MFWNSEFLNASPSHIDVLLQSQDTRLSDILFEEDILQEIKTNNVTLTNFLVKQETLTELVDNITQLTEEDCCDKSIYSRVHAAYVSCEILTACSSEIFDALLQNSDSLNKIISCLTLHNQKLVPQKVLLISKLISNIHSLAPADLSCHVTKNIDIFKALVDLLVDNIDISGSYEILSTFINRTNPPELRYVFCEILCKLNFHYKLMDVMAYSKHGDKQRNACQLICDIIVIGRQEASEQVNDCPTARDMLSELLETSNAVTYMLHSIFPGKMTNGHCNGLSGPSHEAKDDNLEERNLTDYDQIQKDVYDEKGKAEGDDKKADGVEGEVSTPEYKADLGEEKEDDHDDEGLKIEEENTADCEENMPINDEKKLEDGEDKLDSVENKPDGATDNPEDTNEMKASDDEAAKATADGEKSTGDEEKPETDVRVKIVDGEHQANDVKEEDVDRNNDGDDDTKTGTQSAKREPNATAILCCIKALQTLVEKKVGLNINNNNINQSQQTNSSIARTIEDIQHIVADHLTNFHELLLNPPKQEPIKTTFGVIHKPLGYMRLEVVNLIRALLSTNSPVIIRKLVELKMMKVIIDLFIEYSWNNLLHTQVERALCLIIKNCRHDEDQRDLKDLSEETANEKATMDDIPSRALLSQLLNECDLIGRLLLPTRNDEQANFGHIIQIINSIAINCDLDTIQDHLNAMKDKRPQLYDRWTSFVNVDVASFKEISLYCDVHTLNNHVEERDKQHHYLNSHNTLSNNNGPSSNNTSENFNSRSYNGDDGELMAYLSFTRETVIPSINVDVLPKSRRSTKTNNY